MTTEPMTSTSTTANEHLQAIRVDVDLIRHALPPEAPDDEWPINDTMCDSILTHAAAMAQQLADVQEVCRNLSEAEREYEAEHGAMAARIEALEARNGLLETLYRAVEENGGYNDMHDDVWAAMDALTHDDLPNDGSNGR